MRDLMKEFQESVKDKGYKVKCNECIYEKDCGRNGKASDECNFPSYKEYIKR